MKKFSTIILLGLSSCVSDFQKGQEKFDAGEFEEARQFFKKIDKDDKDFQIASRRLADIDSIIGHQIFKLATKEFAIGNVQDAKVLFLKIEKDNELYNEASLFLHKIDSIEKWNRNNSYRQTQAKKFRHGSWYEGGTLHKATVKEWKNAAEENKLATCGDFMTALDNSVGMEILLARATALKACINEATRGITNVDDDEVAEIASLCTLTLGYKKK